MHVWPGRGWHDVPSDWLEAIVEVEIPEAGEVEVRIAVARGGRLLLDVTDVDGRYPECPCSLRGPDGGPVGTYFAALTESDGLVLSL